MRARPVRTTRVLAPRVRTQQRALGVAVRTRASAGVLICRWPVGLPQESGDEWTVVAYRPRPPNPTRERIAALRVPVLQVREGAEPHRGRRESRGRYLPNRGRVERGRENRETPRAPD